MASTQRTPRANFIRPLLSIAALAIATTVFGQTNTSRSGSPTAPHFEVATIKPHDPDVRANGGQGGGRNFEMLNASLTMLLSFAYGVQAKQIDGAPLWAQTDKFDVNVLPGGEGQPSLAQSRTMMQTVLAERFKVALRFEKRELPVYAIGLSKSGPKMMKAEDDPNKLPSLLFGKLGNLTVRNANMADLASLLQEAVLDRPVVDQTGLVVRYDFMLRWTPDETQFGSIGIKIPSPTNEADAAPGLFTAIQEQIGLKLTATRAPAQVLVIEHLERPSEN